MKARLAYGKSDLDIVLPEGVHVETIEPRYVAGVPDGAGAVTSALREPFGSKPLRERIASSPTVGIVVNDITRATPYRVILPALLAEMRRVPEDRITIFVATGTHRPCTPAELDALLGPEVADRFRVVQNDAGDRSSHALAGTTRGGNAVWIHRDVLACDLRILTGFIEPHFFAGFSGGGKAVMPGMALLETVLRNHSPAHIGHPQATWGVTQGNPVWEEVCEAARMAGPSFLLNVTLNRDKEITGVFAGDVEQAHQRGCEFVRRTAMVPVSRLYDIVITSNSGYPLDLNLYQAVKGMSAAAQIVKPGGVIILAAECWDGIPDHGQYKRLLHEAGDPESLLEKIRTADPPIPDGWQAQIHAAICRKAEVYLFSGHLTDRDIRQALLQPSRDIAATVKELIHSRGRETSVAVLPEGPQTIPYIPQ
jgi:nickel-dependent lactate racemase